MSLPAIRVDIQVDQLRVAVREAFAGHHGDVSEAVQQHIDAAIREFDFSAEVRKHVRGALEKATREATERAANALFWGEETKALIQRSLVQAMVRSPMFREELDGMGPTHLVVRGGVPQCFGKEYDDQDNECMKVCPLREECWKVCFPPKGASRPACFGGSGEYHADSDGCAECMHEAGCVRAQNADD